MKNRVKELRIKHYLTIRALEKLRRIYKCRS